MPTPGLRLEEGEVAGAPFLTTVAAFTIVASGRPCKERLQRQRNTKPSNTYFQANEKKCAKGLLWKF